MGTRRRTGDTPSRPSRPVGGAPPGPGRPDLRVHDVVDAASGRVETVPVVRALTPATRVRRLAPLGFRVPAWIFGTPTHRLTAQRPYQQDPEGWLDVNEGAYNAGPGVDRIWWRMPPSFPTEFLSGVNFTFSGVAAGPALLSLTFEAWPYQGATGTVVIDIGAQRTEIPVSVGAARTVDIALVHPGGGPVDARVFFRPGMIDFVFTAVTLGTGPIVFEPEVLDPGP